MQSAHVCLWTRHLAPLLHSDGVLDADIGTPSQVILTRHVYDLNLLRSARPDVHSGDVRGAVLAGTHRPQGSHLCRLLHPPYQRVHGWYITPNKLERLAKDYLHWVDATRLRRGSCHDSSAARNARLPRQGVSGLER